MPGRTVVLALAVAVVLVGAGCSSGDDIPDDQAIVPTSAPSGWVESAFDGGVVHTPGGWEESVTDVEENDTTVLSWQTPVNEHGTRGGLQVTVIGSPDGSVERAAEAVAVNYRAIMEIAEPETVEVTWPGADEAWFVSLTADVRNDDGIAAAHPVQYLVMDRSDGTRISATVTELDGVFSDLELATVLATLTLQ